MKTPILSQVPIGSILKGWKGGIALRKQPGYD